MDAYGKMINEADNLIKALNELNSTKEFNCLVETIEKKKVFVNLENVNLSKMKINNDLNPFNPVNIQSLYFIVNGESIEFSRSIGGIKIK